MKSQDTKNHEGVDSSAQQAIKNLESIEEHDHTTNNLQARVSEAITKRIDRILREKTIGDIEDSEIQTRASMIKDAHRRLVGELEAFVSATQRHEKNR